MKIEVKLFGDMQVKKNGEIIVFPFKKTAILFAYLMIYKKVERHEIAHILWENVDESEIRKNLRNALYTLRKIIDSEIIKSDGNKYLYLNPDYEYVCDYDLFITSKDSKMIVKMFDNFLNNHKLDNNNNYRKWINVITNELLNIYIFACDKLIYSYLDNNDIDHALDILLKKVDHYIYDEVAYREIMNIYLEKKEYDKAIEAYRKISYLLNNELKINCDIETIQLYEKVFNQKQTSLKEKSMNIISENNLRTLNTLNNSYEALLKYSYSDYFLIHGVTGSGKSFILNQFLTNVKNNINVFKIRCYENDNDYVFRSIISFVIELSLRFSTLSFNDILTLTFKEANQLYNEKKRYYYFDEYFIKMLKKISLNNKLIIIVEDCYNMDFSSIELFKKVINESLSNIMIIFTGNLTFLDLIKVKDLKLLKVSSWEKNDVEQYLKKIRFNIKDKDKDNFINDLLIKTNGNPFYIKEFLKSGNISNFSKDQVFTNLYHSLDNLERRIIDLLTTFTRAIAFKNLKSLFTLSEMELMEKLKNLEAKEIILADKNELGITYQISNEQFKKYVYNNINKYVKRQLHNVVAHSIEDNPSDIESSLYLHQILIDHYAKADNKIKELENRIKYYSISNYSTCELFSIMDITLLDSLYLEENDNFEKILNELEIELLSLSQNNLFSTRFKEMSLLFYTMKARYYLKELDKPHSYETIMTLIKHTEADNDIIARQNAYYLMIYYEINFGDYDNLKRVLDKLLQSIQLLDTFSNQYSKSIVTYYRFRGYYYMVNLNIEKALENFKLGLEIINESLFLDHNSFKASIFHYLGQAYMIKKEYDEAIKCFNNCLELLGKDNLLIDAILVTKGLLAITYFLNDDNENAIINANEYLKNENRKNFYLKNRLFNQSFEKIVYNKDISENIELDNNIDYEIYQQIYQK